MNENRRFLVTMGVMVTFLAGCATFIEGFPLSDMTQKNGIAVLIGIYLLLSLIDMNYTKEINKKMANDYDI